jgi:hypothetical protein
MSDLDRILDEELRQNDLARQEILQKIQIRNSEREIICACCGIPYKIRDLVVIQTSFHVPPIRETEGDYWKEGGLEIICPKSNLRNRLMFNNDEIPWEDRNRYKFNPEEQFKIQYKRLFKEIKEFCKERDNSFENPMHPKKRDWVNNWYIDENREKFGLVLKRKN